MDQDGQGRKPRKCKNYKYNFRECNTYIEHDRASWAVYCKKCGAGRSKAWKKENPDLINSADFAHLVKEWRKTLLKRKGITPAEYMSQWRADHYEQYREQNNRHARACRRRKKLEEHPDGENPPC